MNKPKGANRENITPSVTGESVTSRTSAYDQTSSAAGLA
jgi:hypothetical protein